MYASRHARTRVCRTRWTRHLARRAGGVRRAGRRVTPGAHPRPQRRRAPSPPGRRRTSRRASSPAVRRTPVTPPSPAPHGTGHAARGSPRSARAAAWPRKWAVFGLMVLVVPTVVLVLMSLPPVLLEAHLRPPAVGVTRAWLTSEPGGTLCRAVKIINLRRVDGADHEVDDGHFGRPAPRGLGLRCLRRGSLHPAPIDEQRHLCDRGGFGGRTFSRCTGGGRSGRLRSVGSMTCLSISPATAYECPRS